MIETFKTEAARVLFVKGNHRDYSSIAARALKKLLILDQARSLDDLKNPPGNRLEALKGDRAGRYSLRINDQYRLCFLWKDGGAYEVEIVDYH